MSFGLMNASDFVGDRAMDINFVGERDKFVVIYLDDITMFSNSDADHLKHLRQTFNKCRKYGLSLNPKKSHISMQEGKLLGHIVSKYGIKVDPKRVQSIDKINLPRNKKEIQSLLGRINSLRRFIPNFAEIIKLITDIVKKHNEVKWRSEAKVSFQRVNKSIGKTPVLVSLDYSKDFLIFSFASKHTVATVLLHKNNDGFEQPISFYSKKLKDPELKYDILEKQVYAMVKSLKSFMTYVLHSKVIAYVPTSTVKEILIQPDSDGKRGKWLEKIQEYDLETKPTKLVNGNGLTKLLVESNIKSLGINHFDYANPLPDIEESDDQVPTTQIDEKFSSSSWYKNIFSFLLTLQCPFDMTPSKARTLKLQAIKYCIIDGKLYWKDPLGFLLRCLIESETKGVIE
jgi:hypothetical protein